MQGQSDILSSLQEVTQEILGLDTFEKLLSDGVSINHYIGFEISGLVHLGTGLMTGIVVKRLQDLGINTSFYLADWHSWINDKLGGDREFISKVSREYFQKAMLVSAKIAGADQSKIKIVEGSALYHNNDRYWQTMVELSKNLTLSRVIKSTAIMGRTESASMPFAFMLYPPMQCSDIFEMEAHIAHAGMDQRKIHVIAREVAEKLSIHPLLDADGNKLKPIAIHHRLLLGLQKPSSWPLPDGEEKDVIRTQMKMSKSVKGSAIFIQDSELEIREKLKAAFCPEKETSYNPVIDWAEHLKSDFANGLLHPVDLKNAMAEALIELLAPAREAFKNDGDLIEKIKEMQSR
ncbi:MAG: tyrosine--tRNA ligase [Candidatus Roizmanbacteria bacterium]